MTGKVLILGGSGKIGHHAGQAFKDAGWQVDYYHRGTDMTNAAQGADVIVNGLNPPAYHDWANLIPQITAQVIAAARASGATVIIPGNVYNYGDRGGEWSDQTQQSPVSRKGLIRKEMEETYRAAGVPVIILRAGNFIDPLANGDVMSMVHLRGIQSGKLTIAGGPDVMQAYCFLPDWARAAVMLANRRADLAPFEDIPFPGHAFSGDQMKAEVERQLGRPVRFSRFPWWLMTALSPVWELAREMREMRYLWETPHWLARDKFDRLLPGFQDTPFDAVIRASLAAQIDPDKAVRSGGKPVVAQ